MKHVIVIESLNDGDKSMSHSEYLNRIIKVQSLLASAGFNLKSFMQLAVNEMKTLTPATGVVIELVEGNEMVYKAATGTMKKYIGLRLKKNHSISGLCVQTQKILQSRDTEIDHRVNVEACRQVKARSLIVAPLFHQGNAVGVLKIVSKNPNAFKAKDAHTLQIMAGLIGAALAHQMAFETTEKLLKERTFAFNSLEKAQKALRKVAHYDSVTGLPNRNLFRDRLQFALERLKRKKELHALMYLDLDHFKTINDTYGHDIGDKLLKSFGSSIKTCIRSADVAARLGGDEFVILLENITEPDQALKIGTKIIKKINQPIKIKKLTLLVTTSIGLTFFEDDSKESHEIIKEADQALYQAKKTGRNNIKMFHLSRQRK